MGKVKSSMSNDLGVIDVLAWVAPKMNNAIYCINHYPADSVVCVANTYPLDNDLSGGYFKQLRPENFITYRKGFPANAVFDQNLLQITL